MSFKRLVWIVKRALTRPSPFPMMDDYSQDAAAQEWDRRNPEPEA